MQTPLTPRLCQNTNKWHGHIARVLLKSNLTTEVTENTENAKKIKYNSPLFSVSSVTSVVKSPRPLPGISRRLPRRSRCLGGCICLPIGNWQSAIGNHSRIPQRSQRLSGCISSPKGFTLTELLIVIGIIAVLMGILFPVIKKVRYAAYKADTQNEISQISNACNAYYTTFHAYPGPLSNDQIEVPGSTTTLLYKKSQLELYAPPAALTVIPGRFSFTGAENLVLGLMGGLRAPDSAKPSLPQFPNGLPVFAPTEVGFGPLDLNPLSPSRTPSFFPNGSNYLVWCEQPSTGGAVFQSTSYQAKDNNGNVLNLAQFTDAAQQFAQDSPIPEFVDRYPSPGAMPILYLRARTGAQGVVSDGFVLNPANSQLAQYQYDLRDIAPYVMPNPNNSNHCIGVAPGQNQNLQSVGAFAGSVNNQAPPTANAGIYFVNSSITPTGADPNSTGRPRAVDMFILISAGPDGIYGTPDDITSFGDVSQ